jgi:hypothetical protein
MPAYIATLTRHHNVDNWLEPCIILDADNLAAATRAATAVFAMDYIPELEEFADADKLREAVEQAYLAGETDFTFTDDSGEICHLVIWCRPRSDNDKTVGLTTGFGLSTNGTIGGTDKYDNFWVDAEEWAPDPAARAALQGLSKEELIEKILRLEAAR